MRLALACVLIPALGCGRDQGGTPDDQLKGLVTEAKPPAPVDVDQATKDPAELTRAMASSHEAVLAALGPHALAIETRTVVEEGGKPTTELSDKAVLEIGTAGSFHGEYTNSADYGRETVFIPPASPSSSLPPASPSSSLPPASPSQPIGGKLYLRPRYQRWHGRAPETAAEPAQLRETYFAAIGATWDLVAPGAELTDKGPVQVAGRAGRKIMVKLAPSPRENPRETLSQRRWRESRTITALDGEVVLDADKGVPLTVALTGAVAFSRDGRRFTMKLGVSGGITKLGAAQITPPPEGEVVATPTRRGEVDERDYLLHGIAPPIRKNSDGTAVKPAAPPVTK